MLRGKLLHLQYQFITLLIVRIANKQRKESHRKVLIQPVISGFFGKSVRMPNPKAKPRDSCPRSGLYSIEAFDPIAVIAPLRIRSASQRIAVSP